MKSIIARVGSKFNVSIAEVDEQGLWQSAVLGFCCVSNNGRYNNEVVSKVVDFIANGRFEVEVLGCETEIIPF